MKRILRSQNKKKLKLKFAVHCYFTQISFLQSRLFVFRYAGNRPEGGAAQSANVTSGFQPGRPTSTKKEPLKFDNDYDFEKANEDFKEFCTQFEVTLF